MGSAGGSAADDQDGTWYEYCNLDLLAKAPDLPVEEAEAALSDAQVEADRMGRLVGDLLTLARADAVAQIKADAVNGYKKYTKKVVDLDSLLLEVFRQYRPEKGNGVEVESTLGKGSVFRVRLPVV